jgi:hypothetical protein
MILTKRDLLKAKNGAILQFTGEDNGTGNVAFNNNLALSASSPVTMSMNQTFNIAGADAYFSNNINTSGSLNVASATTLADSLTVTQGSTLQGTLDVTGESIFATHTTVSGTLKAEGGLDFSPAGGNLKVGSINALTVNSSGDITKIGQDTPGNGQFLKWDGNKLVWDSASVTALSLDAITAATSAETRVQTSGNLHLDSTGGEVFLSSSDDFNFISTDTNSHIILKNTPSDQTFSIAITDQSNNTSQTHIATSGFDILDKTRSSSNLSSVGVKGLSILSNNYNDSAGGAFIIGTRNVNISDPFGQNTTGSLVFQSTDKRFIFADSGNRDLASASAYPFFNIKKIRSTYSNSNSNFDVEFNVTKGQAGSWLTEHGWDNLLTHATFLKFNQDGKITKLGHDTPTAGQVLSWDNTNSCVVWSDASTGSETLAGLTDTDITSPADGDYLKYNLSTSKWVPSTGPVNETYSSKTSNFTAVVDYHYSVNTTNNSVTISLPEITNNNVGKKIILKFKSGSNSLIANPYSGETIEENNNFIFSPNQSPGQSITLVSDGVSNWEII